MGEHFGVSIVEAMADGLIPIVPEIGGPTEFVPKKFHYPTLEQAAETISSYAFDHLAKSTTTEGRLEISNSVSKFSAHSQRIVIS
jgi:hypothetical protein